jgi:glycosyltransferase involved in cell wall biosynthesis
MTKISVVVAAYNSPPELDDLVRSLDEQTMDTSEFEIIFVDDGSTDATYARLQEIASTRPNATATTIENSGWPGRPRNVGTAMAGGEYVFYMDHDDYLFPEALERMYALAADNQLDVVHPKEVVHGWSTPGWNAWKHQEPRIGEYKPSTVQCITPHKLYRREFLLNNNIAFPEGRIRLEDFSFNGAVWAKTDAVGMLADYPCYRWMIYDDNSHKKGYNFDVYWDSFESSLAPVLELPDESPKKDVLLLRWYRSRILERMAGIYSTYPEEYRTKLTSKATALLRYFPEHLDRHLSPAERLRSYLLRKGDTASLLRLSELDRGTRLAPRLVDASWEGGKLRLEVFGVLVGADETPLPFEERDGRVYRLLPEGTLDDVPDEILDVTDALRKSYGEIAIRGRDSSVDWLVPSSGSVLVGDHGAAKSIGFELVTHIDPETAAFGGRLGDEVWDVFCRLNGPGYAATHRIKADTVDSGAALVHGRSAVVYRTEPGHLAIDLDSRVRTLVGTARPTHRDVEVDQGRQVLLLPRVHVAGRTRLEGHFECADGTTESAVLEGSDGAARVVFERGSLNLQGSRAVFQGRRSAPILTEPVPVDGGHDDGGRPAGVPHGERPARGAALRSAAGSAAAKVRAGLKGQSQR